MDCSWELDRRWSFDDEPASDGAQRSPHMSTARVTPTNHLLKLSTPRRVSFSWADSPSKRPTSPRLVIFNECSIIDSNEPESPKLQLLKLPLLDNVPPAPKRQRVEGAPPVRRPPPIRVQADPNLELFNMLWGPTPTPDRERSRLRASAVRRALSTSRGPAPGL